MAIPDELRPDLLRRRCEPAGLPFATTDDAPEARPALGQPRAAAALGVGLGMEHDGFNVYALGNAGTGRHFLVEQVLHHEAQARPAPFDLVYVHNFDEAAKPHAIFLPAGRGLALQEAMKRLIEEVVTALPAAFESEEYQSRLKAIEDAFKEKPEAGFKQIQERARERGLAMLATPVGMVFAPSKDGEVLDSEAFEALPEEEQKRIREDIEVLQQELQRVLRAMPGWDRERRERVRELDNEVSDAAVGHLVEEVQQAFDEPPRVRRYLEAVRDELIDNAAQLLKPHGRSGERRGEEEALQPQGSDALLRRFRVNVLVDHASSKGAPVVSEDNPTYPNLVGRVEYVAQMGTLVTDFNLIRPGALHRANGGFLVLDARQVLQQPYAWEGLKRALKSRQIRIESLGQTMGLVSTVSLEPEPARLDVKVVLVGDRLVYYLLCAYDPEFLDLFKVAADFDDEMPRTSENEAAYAALVAALVRGAELPRFDAAAVARIIEHASRMVGDAERLTTRTGPLVDLLREAAFHAAGTVPVGAEHVQRAIDQQRYRADRVRERLQEAMLRRTLHVDTDGTAVGQVNGLSVITLGPTAFGHPSRITARVRLGRGEVTDIEREVELGGPIHSKGVLILAGFLGARFAGDGPLPLAATLVFEQSYAGVEGDSASSAELYVLLSAIAEVPLRQDLAVTGSVDQHGNVQAIGGVNEKIEGFFELCSERELTGSQGVLIPRTNVPHLMLRPQVVEAVEEGRFHIYPVGHVDEGIELLSGLAAGERDPEGAYPEGSVNARVADRLQGMADRWAAFGNGGARPGGENGASGRP
jgi:lon-related putative ATP-dependent protease